MSDSTTPITIAENPLVPTVTLTIAPPSRPQTPKVVSRLADHRADSLSSPSNLSPLSPTFPRRDRRDSLVPEASDDYGLSICASSVTNLSAADEEDGARITVYHIYHAGREGSNFTVHTVKDTKLVEQLHEEIGPVILDRGCGCWGNRKLACTLQALGGPNPMKIKADDNKTDPREATYYLHSPFIWFHEPAQTLRFGGNKIAPVICLIQGSFFWRTWRLDFAVPEVEDRKKGKKKSPKRNQENSEINGRVDSGFGGGGDGQADAINKETQRRWRGLNEPGVIDPRGVLVSKYPLRVPGPRPGESGKKYVKEKTKHRKSLPITPEQVTIRINQSNSFSGKTRDFFRPRSLFTNSIITAPPPTPSPESIEKMLPGGLDPQDLPDHLKPDSLEEGSLLMKWSGWLTREYEFIYKGVEFRWKGTGTVKDEKKYLGPLLRYNHLKLVAVLPDDGEMGAEEVEVRQVGQERGALQDKDGELRRRGSFGSFISLISRRDSGISGAEQEKEGEKRQSGRQIVIAKYTCLAALRKTGRLVVYEHGLEQATAEHVKSGGEDVFNTEKERLRHLTVATALCMVQAEKEKRDTIVKIIEILIAGGEGAGG